ncbi:hypothetical protein QR680_015487 [Steinernema hermaphroditum]|uniref:Nematode cuticle collagen N-terminal domain-containing protein n=1 Tax=Steinernema hermaphroditum TaxID=289476 RepID=A0AA39LKX6_9BILA|nr:hypothetical protein QR680_015487 [Steinernema hermaphroditum]
MSGIKAVAFLASAGSGIAIAVSLLVIGNLFMEVNDMYREVLADMDEFKTLSNQAWKGMMDAKIVRNRNQFNFDSIFRQKRQYDAGVSGGTQTQGGGCQCSRQAGGCPAGLTPCVIMMLYSLLFALFIPGKVSCDGLYDRGGVRADIKQPTYYISQYDLPNVSSDLEASNTKIGEILNDPVYALGDGFAVVDKVVKPMKYLLRYRIPGDDGAIQEVSTMIGESLLKLETSITSSTISLDEKDELKNEAHIHIRNFASDWRRVWTYFDTMSFYRTICTSKPYSALSELSAFTNDRAAIEKQSEDKMEEFKKTVANCAFAFAIPAHTCAILNGMDMSEMIDERMQEIDGSLESLSS